MRADASFWLFGKAAARSQDRRAARVWSASKTIPG